MGLLSSYDSEKITFKKLSSTIHRNYVFTHYGTDQQNQAGLFCWYDDVGPVPNDTGFCAGGLLFTRIGTGPDDQHSGWADIYVRRAVCGNGHKEGSEACDDGNTTNGDGCSSTCQTVCDHDKDSYLALECGGKDCDDTNNAIYPKAGDSYGDGVDGDCDGLDCAAGTYENVYYVACINGHNSIGIAASKTACVSAGYDGLATILDDKEQTYVTGLTAALPEDGLWMGLGDAETEGTFVWTDGSPLLFTNWMPGNPGNSGEDCVEYYLPSDVWNDISCSWLVDGFLCGTRVPACGNGKAEGAGEACDDGNTTTEQCAYGQTSCTVCDATCQSVPGQVTGYCGDGTTNGPETCDDGNTAVGDGCDASCQDETPTVVTFDATGNDQSWYVPPGVTQITVKSWGAGGGANDGSGHGGGGGYAETTLSVVPCQKLMVVVGMGGSSAPAPSAYGGGGQGASTHGGGGGLSGVFDKTYDQAGALVIAGGGGGGGDSVHGGAGGGLVGQSSSDGAGGEGGTQEAGGNAGTAYGGSAMQGGTTNAGSGGGGGGGYFGGGGGTSTGPRGEGGGGSGYLAVSAGLLETGDYATPGNASDPARGNAGEGGTSASTTGTSGRVVIEHYAGDGSIHCCGNEQVEGDEQCDDGNTTTETCPYGQTECTVCDATCQSVPGVTSYCGNDLKEDPEACDDGNTSTETCPYGQTECTVCDTTCQSVPGVTSYCGNDLKEGTETCDDGNTLTEQCAYGQSSCTVCDATCQSVPGQVTGYCGDGITNGPEACDDGGTADGDGCSATCKLQSQGIDCADIHYKNPGWPDGTYVIDPDEGGPIAPVKLFCDMTNGGWTLVGNYYDSPGDDMPNETSYVVSGWQQTASGNWTASTSVVDRAYGGTGSAAVSMAFVEALGKAASQHLKMCFVHKDGQDTACRSSHDGTLTLVSYTTGNAKLTKYKNDKLTYTFGRLGGLAGSVDGYDFNKFELFGYTVPRVGLSPLSGWGDSGKGVGEHSPTHDFEGVWHGFGCGISLRPWHSDDSELGGGSAPTSCSTKGPNPSMDTYGFRLYIK
jgi:cysteine-rich repeat protein